MFKKLKETLVAAPVFALPDLIPKKILNKRMGRRKGRIIMEVLVQWKGLPDEEASWMYLFQMQKQHPSFRVSDP